MNPEIPHDPTKQEPDDSPYAETRNKRAQYETNLAEQRANDRRKDNEPRKNLIEAASKFKQSEHPSAFQKPDVKKTAKEAVGAYRRRQFMKDLGMDGRTEYMHKSEEEKELQFQDWLKNRTS